jgi:hypothetical protein
MNRSIQVASYLGPVLILLAISEALNLRIWASGDATLTYQAGLIWLLGGLAIVRLHNRWSMTWPVTITLAGWFFLVGGAFRMMLPEAQQGNQNTPVVGTYALDVVLLAIGVLLTFQGFRRRHEGRPSEAAQVITP